MFKKRQFIDDAHCNDSKAKSKLPMIKKPLEMTNRENECSKPKGLAALFITRQLSRIQSKREAYKPISKGIEEDSLSDDEEDFDLYSFQNVRDVISNFFSDIDVEDELYEFQSNLEEEIEEGLRFLQGKVEELQLLGAAVVEKESDMQQLNRKDDEAEISGDIAKGIDIDQYGLDDGIEALQKLREHGLAFEDKMLSYLDKLEQLMAASEGAALQDSPLNTATYEMLQRIITDLIHVSKTSMMDAVERQSQILDGTSCLNLLGHEMQSLPMHTKESSDLVDSYTSIDKATLMLRQAFGRQLPMKNMKSFSSLVLLASVFAPAAACCSFVDVVVEL